MPWVLWIWLEEDWVPWAMVGNIVPEEWLLALAALINTLLVLIILFWTEGEEDTMPYTPKKKRPHKPTNKCMCVVGCLLGIAK